MILKTWRTEAKPLHPENGFFRFRLLDGTRCFGIVIYPLFGVRFEVKP